MPNHHTLERGEGDFLGPAKHPFPKSTSWGKPVGVLHLIFDCSDFILYIHIIFVSLNWFNRIFKIYSNQYGSSLAVSSLLCLFYGKTILVQKRGVWLEFKIHNATPL